MNFQGKMRYLGLEPKTSKKSGNSYFMAKLMHGQTILEFYVPADKILLVTELGKTDQFAEIECEFELSAYNGKNEVSLNRVIV